MALTITIEGTGVIANCDAIADTAGGTWYESGGGSIDLSEDVYLIGSASIGGKYASKAGIQVLDKGASTYDFTETTGTEAGQYLYIWIAATAIYTIDALSTYPLCIRLSSGAYTTAETADYVDFLIAGNDDTNGWSGGWKCFVIDPTLTPSRYNGTIATILANIRTIGIWIDCNRSARADSFFVGGMAIGNGLRITGTSTTGWLETVNYCTDYATRGWGMFQEREGIFYSYGKTYIGDATSQTAAVSFVDSSRVIQFGTSEYCTNAATGVWETSMPADVSGIVIEDKSTFPTTFKDGILVGSDKGRSGTLFIGNDDSAVSMDFYGGNEATSLTELYGTSFKNITGSIVSGNDVDHKLFSVVFEGCAQFDPVGAPVLRNLSFSDNYLTGGYDAALLWNADINISDSSFLANEYAIEHDTAASGVEYKSLIFSGQFEYDILFTDTGVLEVLVTGGTIPTWSGTAGGTVSLPSSITLTMTVYDESATTISGAYAYIDDDDAVPYIMNTITDVNGVATTPYTGEAVNDSIWRVRKYGYKPYKQIIDIGSSNIDIPVTLIIDPQQN